MYFSMAAFKVKQLVAAETYDLNPNLLSDSYRKCSLTPDYTVLQVLQNNIITNSATS